MSGPKDREPGRGKREPLDHTVIHSLPSITIEFGLTGILRNTIHRMTMVNDDDARDWNILCHQAVLELVDPSSPLQKGEFHLQRAIGYMRFLGFRDDELTKDSITAAAAQEVEKMDAQSNLPHRIKKWEDNEDFIIQGHEADIELALGVLDTLMERFDRMPPYNEVAPLLPND